jgi:hypothetical protein
MEKTTNFDEWFALTGYPETERKHLQEAFNYALGVAIKEAVKYAK